MDSIFIERLWRSLKFEEIYHKEYDSVAALKTAMKAYFYFYNYERPHSAFSGKTPTDVFWGSKILPAAA